MSYTCQLGLSWARALSCHEASWSRRGWGAEPGIAFPSCQSLMGSGVLGSRAEPTPRPILATVCHGRAVDSWFPFKNRRQLQERGGAGPLGSTLNMNPCSKDTDRTAGAHTTHTARDLDPHAHPLTPAAVVQGPELEGRKLQRPTLRVRVGRDQLPDQLPRGFGRHLQAPPVA